MKNKSFMDLVNKQAFFPPAIILVILVIIGAVFPASFGDYAGRALSWITENLGWFFTASSVVLLVFCLWAGFSKYGKIKLGGPDAKPQLSKLSWFAVSFTSSLAIGVSYWCVSEPMTFFQSPPTFLGIEPNSVEAAQVAMRYTYLHWSFIPFAIYVAAGLSVAFLFYNAKLPFRISSSLYPILGERALKGKVSNAIDAFAAFSMVGGLGASLGMGTMQIASGIEYVLGIESNITVWTGIIVVMTVLFISVACSGILKGVKWVGNVNMMLYFAILIFVFVNAPTRSIIEAIITSVGDFVYNFVPLATNLDPIQQTGWHEGWTIFYWAWWISVAPLTGLFMIKLAKGRTIREFVLINLVAPACFVFIWFGTFGYAGIFSDMFSGSNIAGIIAESGTPVGMFALLQQYPLAMLTSVVAIILVAMSFNTQAEAVCVTLAALTSVGFDESGNEKDPPKPIVIFWGLALSSIALILLYAGGEQALGALQSAIVVCALPIVILQVVMAYSYFKCMMNCEKYDKVGTFDDARYKSIVADHEE